VVSEEAYNEVYAAALAQLNREKAAVATIVRAWQRFSDVRIYRYYRDLIKFRERGDPQLMLKCINPGEASLVDAAAGIHVRFRLGGMQFPPVIYYKIFVHQALVDINAFAPRAYTKVKEKEAKTVNNKTRGPLEAQDHSGWYERVENNGWRPVADRALQMADATTQETSCRVIPFHHKKSARQHNKKQWLKLRKREWMMKMYSQNKSTIDEWGEKEEAEGYDPGDFEDDEGEAAMLIDWSEALDFDSYTEDWGKLATSSRSELFMGTSDAPLDLLLEGDVDAYEGAAKMREMEEGTIMGDLGNTDMSQALSSY